MTTPPSLAQIDGKVAEVLGTTEEDIYSSPPAAVAKITSPSSEGFAKTIDHTLLKPDATGEQIDRLCEEARKWGFKSCCVNGVWAERVTRNLEGSGVETCVVVGFPLGAGASEAKAFETSLAVRHGAHEIDTVLPLGPFKSKDYTHVFNDIHAVVVAAEGRPVKVILETVFLSPEEIVVASYISAEAGAAFVKTSTGFSGGGATPEDVRLMKRTVEYKGLQVKASGAVRTLERSLQVLRAGAERIGTSSGVAIMEGGPEGTGY
ncbi:hypothetical protein DFH27DRAFT_610764 [Peziza echinospora]|nr:hypothetical protein DFH27DRAFT_610764 [Peziza echinospora]